MIVDGRVIEEWPASFPGLVKANADNCVGTVSNDAIRIIGDLSAGGDFTFHQFIVHVPCDH